MNEWVELGQNKDGTHNICCGVCGVGKFKSRGHARSYYTRHKFKYCPNCGARMADRKTEPQTSKIIEAYSKGFEDGADAVKSIPQTERLCDNCEYYGGGEVCDHPSIGEVEMGGKGDTFPWTKETPKWCPLKTEPQTETQIKTQNSNLPFEKCEYCEYRYERYVGVCDMCELIGDELQTDCSWK